MEQLTRTELAKRWHISIKCLRGVMKQGELKSSQIKGRKNQSQTVFSIEDIEEFEELKGIPKDPISFQELRVTPQKIYYMKQIGKVKNFCKLNKNTTIYSKKEFE